jgi:hypothetical protein
MKAKMQIILTFISLLTKFCTLTTSVIYSAGLKDIHHRIYKTGLGNKEKYQVYFEFVLVYYLFSFFCWIKNEKIVNKIVEMNDNIGRKKYIYIPKVSIHFICRYKKFCYLIE